ncbi:hypothetical protein BpHYR1_001793 [Brachionus plicatilis]|uniref:Uncharacterized protein n=1 Tax=Brachionus plicatilis TaxID=10195 RepID=A0A3M7RLB1_BRAPC|nr:hypothetical protein BpHYR1_001793 [Brachionus plicatilis]
MWAFFLEFVQILGHARFIISCLNIPIDKLIPKIFEIIYDIANCHFFKRGKTALQHKTLKNPNSELRVPLRTKTPG